MFQNNTQTHYQKRKYFSLPKYRVGDVVLLKLSDTKGKTLEQGVITSSWIEEDDIGQDTFLQGEWEYKVKVTDKEIIKREKSILFKVYDTTDYRK